MIMPSGISSEPFYIVYRQAASGQLPVIMGITKGLESTQQNLLARQFDDPERIYGAVPASGLQGEIGPQGPAGLDGSDGSQGPPGPPGSGASGDFWSFTTAFGSHNKNYFEVKKKGGDDDDDDDD